MYVCVVAVNLAQLLSLGENARRVRQGLPE
jgi:hypothetical protein